MEMMMFSGMKTTYPMPEPEKEFWASINEEVKKELDKDIELRFKIIGIQVDLCRDIEDVYKIADEIRDVIVDKIKENNQRFQG